MADQSSISQRCNVLKGANSADLGGEQLKNTDKLLRLPVTLALLGALSILGGCANVAPSQRGTLARPDMQWGFDRAAEAINGHTYASKEAASGGKAVGGGGCGCT
jgi:hypothetical protein